MDRFPEDFAELLTPRGRALADGRDAACGSLQREPFFTALDLLDAKASAAIPALLSRVFDAHLVELNRMLPAAKNSTASHLEVLPKTVRLLTTPMDGGTESPVYVAAEECGLVAMLNSKSYVELVEALCGHPVSGPITMQALCYRPGDYAGPHTDNHPEHAEVKDGYTDVHLTFCTPGVEQQLLVYEHQGHFSKQVSLTGTGTVTAYRLPFWHYTTPMVGSPEARRWLLLCTFTHPPAGA